MKRMLLIDDEPLIRDSIGLYLELSGHQVVVCSSGNKALEFLKNDRFDLIICDYVMPDGDGKLVLNLVKKLGLVTPFLYFSAHSDLISFEMQNVTVIPKPDIKALFANVSMILGD